MKKLNYLLVAAAAVATVNTTFSARAGEPLLSPRAQSNQTRTVPAGTSANDPDLIREWQNLPGSPRAKELAYSHRTVPASGPSIDLAHAPRPTLSPRDSRYEAALRDNAMKKFEIAPLK